MQALSEKVLFITLTPIDSNASAAVRNRSVIAGLVDMGMLVDVVTLVDADQTCDRFHCRNVRVFRRGRNAVHSALVKRENESVPRKLLVKLVRNLYRKVAFYDSTKRAAVSVKLADLPQSNYDFVISSSDPKSSHLCAISLKRQGLRSSCYIQYWGDPWAEDVTRVDAYPKAIIARKERSLLKHADRIVYVSPFTIERQERLFSSLKKKMVFAPIPFDAEVKALQRERSSHPMRLGYFGAYNASLRNILPLYQFCKSNKSVQLIIVGNSDLSLPPDGSISVSPRVSREELQVFEKDCDVHVCILNKEGMQIPGKIYHYAGTNDPILVILDGPNKDKVSEYLSRFKRFVICENNKASIGEAVYAIQQGACFSKACSCLSPSSIASFIVSDRDDYEIK